jgi:hypothetical protein
VGIVQPVAVAHREGPAPADVQLVSVAPDADPTTFSLFIERPGANQATWPGMNAEDTTFVGASRSPPMPGRVVSLHSSIHWSPAR